MPMVKHNEEKLGSISQTQATVTEGLRLRVRGVFEADVLPRLPSSLLWPDSKCWHVEWQTYEREENYEENWVRVLSADARTKKIRLKCEEFYEAVRLSRQDSDFVALDNAFSSLFRCQWRLKETRTDQIVNLTCQYLARLPSIPTELQYEHVGSLPDGYFENSRRAWESLHVVSKQSTNAIRTIIMCVIGELEGVDGEWVMSLQSLNLVAEMIDATVWKELGSSTKIEKHRAFIVRAFLWKYWQTFRTFSAAYEMRSLMRLGYDNPEHLWLHNFDVSPNLSLRAFAEAQSGLGKPNNMCGWALQLMRNHERVLGLDYQLFFARYRTYLANFAIRCTRGSSSTCDGQNPHHCLRYHGLSVEDQSMHDHNCEYRDSNQPHCEPRLVWDEISYRAVDGPRAVSIAETGSGQLRYCRASKRTIAISHVWIHGQGGRPESGINECLHRRYAAIAENLNCDSYWIDVTSIPTNHQLREEAIGYINEVFHTSYTTLIVDKDLMTIDITDASTQLLEATLCALITSDWNARAWTMLEGLKGRKNLYILCKNNQILSSKKLIEHLNQYGDMSINAFAHQIAHILPQREYQNSARSGDLSLEVSGSWLSQRPASRPGDEVVIWSLSLHHKARPCFDMQDFWREQGLVKTGFLLSSAKRLQSPGFSWAPATPYTIPSSRSIWSRDRSSSHQPMPSETTEYAKIMDDGLTGEWYVCEFDQSIFKLSTWRYSQSPTKCELQKIQSKFIRFGHVGALLRPVNASYFSRRFYSEAPDVPGDSQEGILLAVCDTPSGLLLNRTVKYEGPSNKHSLRNQYSFKWTWRGVHQWPREIPLPEMRHKTFFWIS